MRWDGCDSWAFLWLRGQCPRLQGGIQGLDYGGGEIRFDGKVIRKDGKFVLPELKALN
jgi:hypothetical protein